MQRRVFTTRILQLKGDYYELIKKILAVLAIFCVLASAGAICAADNYGDLGYSYADDNSGYAGSNYQDDYGYADDNSGYAGSNYQDDGGWAGSQYNETLENATANAAGEPANATNTNNTTAQAAGEPANTTNATASIPHSMLATGNPIILLMAVGAAFGGYTVLKREK